jgi:4-diphosphocytidyl-2-C-methyl-D-erythritol kinase
MTPGSSVNAHNGTPRQRLTATARTPQHPVRSLRVRSLAKINLDLRVLNKRPDGFHELRTIFQTISLADTIDIEYQRGRTRIDIHSNLNIPDNLIVRAADSVLRAARSTGRVRFQLRKRIPLGSGLGGGSSNAAAVLLALPVMLGKPLPLEKLMEIACELGSDVPFFLIGGTAVGLGRGTELYPLPDLAARPALVITPGIHSSTVEAYRALDCTATCDIPFAIVNSFESVAWQMEGYGSGPDAVCKNDFEPVVFREHSQLKSIKGKLLKLGARPALMSGSGSALFGMFPSRQLRDRALDSFRKEFDQEKVHRVTTVSRSRYRALWRRQVGVSSDTRLWPPQDRYAK